MRNSLLILVLLLVSFSYPLNPNGSILFESNMNLQSLTFGGILNNQQNTGSPKTKFTDSFSLYTGQNFNIRFQVDQSPLNFRQEIGTIPNTTLANQCQWYQVVLQTPAYEGNDPVPEVHAQINDQSGLLGTNIAITRVGNKYALYNIYWPDGVTQMAHLYDIGTDNAGDVNNFVFRYKRSIGSDGIIEIWRNGSKVFLTNGRDLNGNPLPDTYTITGANANAVDGVLATGQYFKCGCYKPDYHEAPPRPGNFPFRVVFVSYIKFGNANATIADFVTSSTNYILTHKKPYQKSSP